MNKKDFLDIASEMVVVFLVISSIFMGVGIPVVIVVWLLSLMI